MEYKMGMAPEKHTVTLTHFHCLAFPQERLRSLLVGLELEPDENHGLLQQKKTRMRRRRECLNDSEACLVHHCARTQKVDCTRWTARVSWHVTSTFPNKKVQRQPIREAPLLRPERKVRREEKEEKERKRYRGD